MGSTDSAGDSHHSGASSCGLVSSLFPNSCRGRAEAFARRLRRRLTSLGSADISSNDESDGAHYNETDSLNSLVDTTRLQSSNLETKSDRSSVSSCNHVLEQQPRHSPETELCYDYGILRCQSDDGGTGIISPAEIVSPSELAYLLVNTTEDVKSNHYDDDENRDSESGYIFSSPLDVSPSNNSSNECYFDPESSDGDKTHFDEFYDPVQLSESDAACDMSYDDEKSDSQKPPGRRRADSHLNKKVDASESSSSMNGHAINESKIISKNTLPCSSEESINDVACSSLDTSPSHESLWSTFEDNTVSQDENLSLNTLSVKDNVPTTTRSQSDSGFILTNVCLPPTSLETPSSNDETDFSNDSGSNNGESENNTGNHAGDAKLKLVNDRNTTYSSSIDIPGELVVECVVMTSQATIEGEILKTEMILNVGENGDNSVQTPQLLKRLSCTPHGSFDKEIEGNGETSLENISEHSDEMDDEDKDEEGQETERPQRLRRCSSLKTGKTPPGTPGRKKIVRFADVLGLDLADVRTFLDEIPKVPHSAFSDLAYDDVFRKESSPNFSDCNVHNGSSALNSMLIPKFNGAGTKPDRVLVPLFQQPGGLPNYLDLIRDRNVCLENVIVQDALAMCIQGTVRVRNLDFHKSVHIRYTLDSWKNFSDLQACYVNNSCDGFSDKFSFQLFCHTLKIGNRLEMAVRYQCKGAQYWDNNAGTNYCFQCLPVTPAANYIPITSRNTCETRDWSPTFY